MFLYSIPTIIVVIKMQLNAFTSVSDIWHKRHQQPESSDSLAHCNNGLCFICYDKRMLALKEQHYHRTVCCMYVCCMFTHHRTEKVIIIIGTTALFEPRPSSEASASHPYRSFHQSSCFGQSGHCFFRFLNNFFSGAVCQPCVQPPAILEDWSDGMGSPISSYATANIALWLIRPHKPHHQRQGEKVMDLLNFQIQNCSHTRVSHNGNITTFCTKLNVTHITLHLLLHLKSI
jgi:hypothetical protein